MRLSWIGAGHFNSGRRRSVPYRSRPPKSLCYWKENRPYEQWHGTGPIIHDSRQLRPEQGEIPLYPPFAKGGDWCCGPRFVLRTGELALGEIGLALRAEVRIAKGGDWGCGPRFVLRKGEIGVAGRDSFCERGRLGLRAEIRFAKGGVQCPEPTIERQCPRDRLDWRFCCVFTGDVIPAKPNSLCFGSGRASHLHRLVTVHPLGVGAVVEADVVAGLFHGQVGERGADAAAAVGDHRVLVGYAGFS